VNISERVEALEATLGRGKKAEARSETGMLLDAQAVTAAQLAGADVSDLALAFARSDHPRASFALQTAALASRDPLALSRLVSRIADLRGERRVEALLGDEARARAAVELFLLAALRDRIDSARKMLATKSADARLLLHNWK